MFSFLIDPLFLIPIAILIHVAIFTRIFDLDDDVWILASALVLVIMVPSHLIFIITDASHGLDPRTMSFVSGLLVAHLLFYFLLPKKK